MNAYINFYARFAVAISTGIKRSTIRQDAYTVGQTVDLVAEGQRLFTTTVTKVRAIRIDFKAYVPTIKLDGDTLSTKSMERLARDDGFADLDDFMEFMGTKYGFPINGHHIEWAPPERTAA